MSRSFAMLSFSLTSSKKIRSLKSDSSRWAYICAHLSELSNYSGMFRYPLSIWASDAGQSLEQIPDCIADLTGAGLVEYDMEEEIIRIISWYHKKNAPENASRVISLIGDYSLRDFEDAGMYCRSVSEFIVGSVRRAQGWKPDSTEWPKLRDAFKPFIAQVYQDEGQPFLCALNTELDNVGKAVQAEIVSLFMPLLELRKSKSTPPCGQGADRVGAHVDETRRDLDGDEYEYKDEEKTAILEAFAHKPSSGSPSPNGGLPRRNRKEAKTGAVLATDAVKNSALARGLK